MKLFDVLEMVEWGMEHFGSVVTNRTLLKRDIMRAVNKRLVRSIGLVTMMDADGGIISPEKYRPGYVLTRVGKSTLRRMRLQNDNTNRRHRQAALHG